MKRLLLCSAILLFAGSWKAQNLSVTASPSLQCYTGTTTLVATAVTTPSATTHYSWTVSSCMGTTSTLVAAPGGSLIPISLQCCGTLTVTCSAWDYTVSTPAQLGPNVVTNPTISCPPQLVLSANTPSVCPGKTSTLTATGGASYTWVPGSIVGNTIFVTPTVTTCYTVMGANTLGCVSVNTVWVYVNSNPVVSASVTPPVACPGGTAMVVAAGNAMNYTISGGVTNGVPFTVTSSNCYTVIGSSAQSCTASAVACVNIALLPSLSIGGISPLCSSNSATLFGGGAVSYTWNNGQAQSFGSNIVVTPSATTCYTLTGYNGTCSAMTSSCLTVNQTPTVVASGPASVCIGNSANLVAGGAVTYTWSNNAPFSSIMVTPFTSQCYTVAGTGSSGNCVGYASVCVTVINPTMTTTASANSVCLGSSINYTAGGVNSYTWSTGPNTPTVNFIPAPNTVYTVSGTDVNGCITIHTVSPFVNTGCADVWPGDANSDGVVGNSDVFEIGLAFSSTGAPRSPGGNAYTSQYAVNWTGTISNGKNKVYADCNGDGVVNNSDTVAIFNNFGLAHAFKPQGGGSAGPNIALVMPATVWPGSWNKADIMAGSSSNPLNSLYGLAFDISFDKTVIKDAYIKYTSSFVNSSASNVEFRKSDMTNGIVHAATVRTNGTNVNGSGKIGELYFEVFNLWPQIVTTNFDIINPEMIANSGVTSTLSGSSSSLTVQSYVIGLNGVNAAEQVSIFPNPSQGAFSVKGPDGLVIFYEVSDLQGRVLGRGEFVGAGTLDLQHLAAGNYVVRLEHEGKTAYKKLLIN